MIPRFLRFNIGPLLFIGTLIGFGYWTSRSFGHEDTALVFLNRSPEAKELLGAPIVKNNLGFSCGNTMNSGGGFGYANWHMAVKGPKGRGAFYFNSELHGETWQLTRGSLKVGKQEIDVVASLEKSQDEMDNLLQRAREEINQNTRAAEADLNSIIEKTAGTGLYASEAYAEFAYIAMTERRYSDCISSATKGIAIDPSRANNYGNRSACYVELKDYSKALVDVNKQIELWPRFAESFALRAKIYQTLGDHPHAKADAERAIQMGYKHPEELAAILNKSS